MQCKADSLLEYFCDDFEDFTVNDFTEREENSRRSLRDYQRENGAYTPKRLGVEIAFALYTICQQRLLWPMPTQISRPWPSEPVTRTPPRGTSHTLELSVLLCVVQQNQWQLLARV